MAWQPNVESLAQLATCLKDSLSGFNKTAQKQAEVVRNAPPLLPSPPPTTLLLEDSLDLNLNLSLNRKLT